MSFFFPTTNELSRHTIFPGVHIAACAGEKLMLSVVDLEANSVVEEHSHPHEQVGILLEGEVTFIIGGESKQLKPGDLWRIPGNVLHKVIVGARPSKAVDIFCPIRQEYL
ncbi:MAG: cupin domain-containing protein [Gemmataceae bacterium]